MIETKKDSSPLKPRSNIFQYRAEDGRIAVIVLNWNGWADTMACLERLRELIDIKLRIVVIDNGSTDDSIERIHKHISDSWGQKWDECKSSSVGRFGDIKILRSYGRVPIDILGLKENTGGAGGRNIGILWIFKSTDWEWAFFLDNDALLNEATIPALIKSSREAHADIAGCIVRNLDSSLQFAGLRFIPNMFYLNLAHQVRLYNPRIQWWPVDEVSSCGMLISKKYLSELLSLRGFCFHPDYFHWSEDQEICLQARSWGRKIIIVRNAVLIHKISGGGAGLATAYYYSSRNRIFLAKTYLPSSLKIPFIIFFSLTRIARASYALVQGRRKLAKAFIQGLWDGLKGISGKIDRF